MNPIVQVRSWAARLALSLCGASVAGLLASAIETTWARSAAGDVMRSHRFALYFADAGLLAPVALALGVAAGLAGLVVDVERAPSPARLAAALRVRAIGRQADVAAFVPLAVLAGFFWMTTAAHLARGVLAVDVGPALAGGAMATGAIGLGLLAGLFVLAMMPPLRHALATASESRPASVDPVATGGVALLAVALLFAFGVAAGTVSGEGGFFGIYGIFKRPELDLRAPAVALAIGIAAFFAPAALARRARPALAIVLALAPLVLTARAAAALNGAPTVTQAIERGAPIGHPALAALRKLADRDHDGVAGLFGGGDCDDHNPAVNPGATEIPDNGVDEDCSGADLSLAAIAKLAPPRPAPRPAADKPKIPADLNVILITVDTMRSDLGYAGNPHPLSPNLDKLAAESVVYERAYSLASYTGKSVGPMLIGKYGSETHRNWGHSNTFSKEDTFLAQRLQRAGVHTVAAHAMRYFGAGTGLERGFDKVDMSAIPAEGSIKEMENSVSGDRLGAAALKLIADPAHTGRRFFLWIHFVDPHSDYLPHPDMPSFGTSQRDLYDGEIAFVDRQIGRILAAIAAAPWGARTAVVVTSDHGEAFSEHKMVRHGFELWEELVRVPLMFRIPGVPPAKIAARRSAIDLAPTLLELLGVQPPTAAGNDYLSGTSLVPDLALPAGASPEARDVLVDMPDGPYNDPRRALIHDDLKLIVSNGAHYELYDLAKDPGERENLLADDPSAAKSVLPYYEAAKARLHEVRVTGEKK